MASKLTSKLCRTLTPPESIESRRNCCTVSLGALARKNKFPGVLLLRVTRGNSLTCVILWPAMRDLAAPPAAPETTSDPALAGEHSMCDREPDFRTRAYASRAPVVPVAHAGRADQRVRHRDRSFGPQRLVRRQDRCDRPGTDLPSPPEAGEVLPAGRRGLQRTRRHPPGFASHRDRDRGVAGARGRPAARAAAGVAPESGKPSPARRLRGSRAGGNRAWD